MVIDCGSSGIGTEPGVASWWCVLNLFRWITRLYILPENASGVPYAALNHVYYGPVRRCDCQDSRAARVETGVPMWLLAGSRPLRSVCRLLGALTASLALILAVWAGVVTAATRATEDTTPPVGSVTIEGGAEYTTTLRVSVAAPATDGGSGVANMRLSNSYDTDNQGLLRDGITYPYTSSTEWDLSYHPEGNVPTDGVRGVHVQWQDGAGAWSTPSVDYITLDTTAPAITVVTPAYGTQDASVATSVSAEFSERMASASLNSSSVTLVKRGSTTPVGAGISYDSSSRAVTVDPGVDLQLGATYVATVKGGSGGARDVAGNPTVSDFRWEFTTADTTPPSGTLSIDNGAAYARSRTVGLTPTATDTGGSGVASMRFSNQGGAWSGWTPYAPSPSRAWTLPAGDGPKTVYAEYRDGSGNVSTVVGDSITLDTLSPSIAPGSPTPANGATGVLRSANVVIAFSEAIDPTTLTGSAFTLRKEGSTAAVEATVRYDVRTTTATLNPRYYLEYATTYSTTLPGGAAGVRDLAGNGLRASVTWSFRTVAAPPNVTSVSPPIGYPGYSIDLTVNGSGFGSGAQVGLVRGSARIAASAVTLVSASRLSARVAIPPGATPGRWDVQVANADAQHDTLSQAFGVMGTYQEDNRAHFAYTGWGTARASGTSGGYLASADRAGSEVTLSFRGTGISWTTAKGPAGGRTDVYLDGTRMTTFDAYARTAAYDVTGYTRGGLSPGAHTLRLVITGRKSASSAGTYGYLDRFVLANGASVQEHSPPLAYGPWRGGASPGNASGGYYRESTSRTVAAAFLGFTGPQVDILTPVGPALGTLRLSFEDRATGATVRTVDLDLRADTTQWRQLRIIKGLARSRTYNLYFMSADGKPVVVDAIRTVPAG